MGLVADGVNLGVGTGTFWPDQLKGAVIQAPVVRRQIALLVAHGQGSVPDGMDCPPERVADPGQVRVLRVSQRGVVVVGEIIENAGMRDGVGQVVVRGWRGDVCLQSKLSNDY